VFRESTPKVALRDSVGIAQAPGAVACSWRAGGGLLEVRQLSSHFSLFFPPRHHDTAEERLKLSTDEEKIGKSGQEGGNHLGIVRQLERVRLFRFSGFELIEEFAH